MGKSKTWDYLTKSDRKIWWQLAKDILRRRMAETELTIKTADQEEITLKTLSQIYVNVAGTTESVGKNWAERTPPAMIDIQRMKSAFPWLQKEVDTLYIAMQVEVSESRKEKDSLIRELKSIISQKDDEIKDLKNRLTDILGDSSLAN